MATAGVVAGLYYAYDYFEKNPTEQKGTCKNSYSANAKDCLVIDANGNPLSIDINMPETPRP